MKVLHLLPRDPERADAVRRVVAALAARGVAAEAWSGPDEGDGARALWERLGATDADLVHAHDGPLALTWPGRVDAATVVTRWEEPDELARAADAQLDPPGADAEATAAGWAEAYAAAHAAHTRRRMDTVGDTRPWGSYAVLDDQDRFKVKRVEVAPGKRLSYQRHRRREEFWLIVAGRARVTLDGAEHDLGPGDEVRIPAGTAHRIENVGTDAVTFVEVQRGDYFGEDDIERLEDDFGRA